MNNGLGYEVELDLVLWVSLRVCKGCERVSSIPTCRFSPPFFLFSLHWFVQKLGLLFCSLILFVIYITKSKQPLSWQEIIPHLSGKNVTVCFWFIRTKGRIPLQRRQVSGLFLGKRSNLIWYMWWDFFFFWKTAVVIVSFSYTINHILWYFFSIGFHSFIFQASWVKLPLFSNMFINPQTLLCFINQVRRLTKIGILSS